ncbi:MAG: glycosyl hydrolase [Lachnospiraceae bacterium]
MFKKILAVLLTATMTVSMLVGCGNSGNGDTPSPTPAATVDETDLGIWSDYQVDLTNNLSNPNATDKTKAVYNWLLSIEGNYIIAGQQEKCGDTGNEEFTYIKGLSEELPGLRGLDFINGDYDGVVRRAVTWDKFNCLISICWHMGVIGDVDGGYNSSQGTVNGLGEILDNPDSEEYKQLIADMDLAAEALKELQDAGVVVLWRPFHEFDGKWFWWGKDGGETFIKLWRLMYDRYTNYHGLNNLIWVLGYTGTNSSGSTSWYPGDEYVDIIGADSYSNVSAANGYSGLFNTLEERLGETGKPAALHECGKIPSISSLQEGNVDWLWFLVWHSGYIDDDKNNTIAEVVAAYQSDYVLTMSEMPDFDALMQK